MPCFGVQAQDLCAVGLSGNPAQRLMQLPAMTAWHSASATVWLPRLLSYQASAHAALGQFTEAWEALTEALRKLTEKNLGNLTPHPLYSSFYYSHPTLLERERALQTTR